MNLLTLQRIKEGAEILENRCQVTDEWINGVNIGQFAYRVNELVYAYERMKEIENKRKSIHVAVDFDSLSEYMQGIWINSGKLVCKHCHKAIYLDKDSGYYIHAGHEKVDGMNGLYCDAAMWKLKTGRIYPGPLEDEE